ncbi:nuclear pore complex protein Nup153 [Anoplophora glabripennis]|uniref:nuclear pore complex protein Nup153 n=1 Tax=Anoplophora glabripennis TaxID=217634 RepID=UPI000874C937|nr:nuclear pore complex protein Nup153 [Anoplophora glabripennis]
MEKDLNDSAVHNTYLRESDSDKSFVGKVKSIISNTPLSKWFRKQDDNRPVIRRRDEVFEDEDISEIQPPSKKAKLPAGDGGNQRNNVLFNETRNPAPNSVSNHIFNKIPEPVAGPSGLKSHKLLSGATTVTASGTRGTFSSNELLNGHSDSEESTSGYSSVVRIGSKEQVCGSQESSKQASPMQTSPSNPRSLFHKSNVRSNRSLFSERSPNMNTSLSSRRPNFNASTFGSPNFIDKTISTKRIINSPFYNGKTIYGGASAYGRSLGRSSQDLKTSLRNSIHIKPVNKTENGNLVLGKTARRILDTIEQYGSPVNDAKKIPIVSRKLRQDGLLSKYTGANPYTLRETRGPPNKELQVPTVPELLKMKTRLQESTESVRQLATSSKSNLNTEYYKISTKEDEKEKHTGKIKTKVTSVRSKYGSNEAVGEVNLAPVSLPITTLPKFDFVIPPPRPTKTVLDNPTQTHTSKPPNTRTSPRITQTETSVQIEKRTTTSTIMEYKFSEPLVIAENGKSIVAINNFKFSEPPACTKKSAMLNFKMPENKPPSLIGKKISESPVKTAKALKSGSITDILGTVHSILDKFKPAQGTWECPVCMIRNKPDKTRCAACEMPRTAPVKPAETKSTFGSQFKLSPDKWECGSCMVHNNDADSKCVSCTAPKPSSATDKHVPSGFGDKFKPSGDTWECDTCMIRNKSDLSKCAACETPNPKAGSQKTGPSGGITGFGSAFKSKNDEWECGTCMVRNKESNTKCQCCETPNPKSAPSNSPALGLLKDKKPMSSFNFGIDKAAATSFSFGIPTTVAVSKTDAHVGSVFGNNSKPAATTPAIFSFGIPPPAQEKPKTPVSSAPKPSVEPPKPNATAPVLPTASNPLKPEEKLPAKTESAPSEFKLTPVVNKEPNILKPEAPDSNKPAFNPKLPTANGEINSNPFGNKTDTTAAPPVTSSGVFAFGTKPAVVAAPIVPTTQPSQSEPAKLLFKFGSATENPPSFPSAKPAATSLNNGFGSTNTASFGVSNKPMTNSTEVKPFAFTSGSTAKDASEPASKVPMFSFRQSASTATTPKSSGFNFGPTTTPSFNFTAGKTESPAFNATPAANMFGGATNAAPQNGTFNFGSMASSNNNQKAGFSFGAAVNNAGGSGSQSGFGFGAPASTFASTSGGFNFTGVAPAFNASAKPSFNFTDGSVTTFSAQPSTDGGVAAPRKIKKAVRRTQR